MRRGDWKIVYRMHTGEVELYNLKEDLAEEHNVASEHPDIVASMTGALSNKLRSWDAVMPIDRTTGKPCPLPDEI